MKRMLFAALGVGLMVAPLVNCGGGGSKDDCGDIAKKACDKYYDCGYVVILPSGPINSAQCTFFLDNAFGANGWSDDRCRAEWNAGKDLSCGDYLLWF